jgi:hypothetical protein
VTLLDFARIPIVSESPHLQWVHDLKLCKFLKEWSNPDLSMSANLQLLHQHLEQINPIAQPSATDKMVIYFWQVFTANTILSSSHLRGLNVSVWQNLQYFHPATGITYQDFLGIIISNIFAPTGKNIVFSLIQGFSFQHSSPHPQQLTDADIYAGRHPCQKYLQSKHKLVLIGSLREIDGAQDFKRTNDGLAKRTSAIKMGEALAQAGYQDIEIALILHRVLRETTKAKKFNTSAPQSADYQQLHDAYQVALAANQQPSCSLATTQERLVQLGNSIRNYSCSRIYSLNSVVKDHGDELLDRLGSTDDSLQKVMNQEQYQQSQQLKQQIHQQIEALATIHIESFLLNAIDYNDSEIAIHQQVHPCTINRRRQRMIEQILNISSKDAKFTTVETACLEVVQDYFITVLITNQVKPYDYHSQIAWINQRWGLTLVLTIRLITALRKLFQQEGLAS